MSSSILCTKSVIRKVRKTNNRKKEKKMNNDNSNKKGFNEMNDNSRDVALGALATFALSFIVYSTKDLIEKLKGINRDKTWGFETLWGKITFRDRPVNHIQYNVVNTITKDGKHTEDRYDFIKKEFYNIEIDEDGNDILETRKKYGK